MDEDKVQEFYNHNTSHWREDDFINMVGELIARRTISMNNKRLQEAKEREEQK